MTTLNASQVRIPSKAFEEVLSNGERIRIRRKDGEEVYLVSRQDLRALEALEDLFDLKEAEEALERFKAGGEEAIPLTKIKSDLGF